MMNLLPWKRTSYKATIEFLHIGFDTRVLFPAGVLFAGSDQDPIIFTRFTEPTWKRGGRIAAIVCLDRETKDALYMVFTEPCKSRYARRHESTESSINIAALKADIIASELGYIISDIFNFTLLEDNLECVAS